MKCSQSRPGFEIVSPCPFPTTITIIPRAPPNLSLSLSLSLCIYIYIYMHLYLYMNAIFPHWMAFVFRNQTCLVGRGVRTHPTNECPRYDTKRYHGQALIMLELWGMRSTPSLPSHPGLQVLCMGWIELNGVLMLNWIAWNKIIFDIKTVYLCLTELFEIELFWHLIVCKQKSVLILNWIVWNFNQNDLIWS